MATLLTKKTEKNCKYFCEKCQYMSRDKNDYNRHLSTRKHTKNTTCYINAIEKTEKNWTCNCSKIFKHYSSLARHKKGCTFANNNNEKEEKAELELVEDETKSELHQLTNLVVEVVKQNQEFQKLIIEQNQKILELSGKGTNINNTNCHNINNKFNLQFFLNEQCKDALNIMDFVKDLNVKLTDLETVGKLGYTEGITKIFINGLKQLDVYKRPIHCSDLKREVLYVKDQNTWEKENEENKKITKAIHHISHKNIQQIPIWVEQNPNCKDIDSKKNNAYLHILSESMGGSDNSNVEKIIHNISKEVVIDKK